MFKCPKCRQVSSVTVNFLPICEKCVFENLANGNGIIYKHTDQGAEEWLKKGIEVSFISDKQSGPAMVNAMLTGISAMGPGNVEIYSATKHDTFSAVYRMPLFDAFPGSGNSFVGKFPCEYASLVNVLGEGGKAHWNFYDEAELATKIEVKELVLAHRCAHGGRNFVLNYGEWCGHCLAGSSCQIAPFLV